MSMKPARNYVDEIATEIWLLCFRLCDKPELRRLSRVCHYFKDLAQPLLFRDQTASAPNLIALHTGDWRKSTLGIHRNAKRLARLAASPHAASVRTWRFSSIDRLTSTPSHITNIQILFDTWARLLGIFTTTLGAYQRLTTLHLGRMQVDQPFRDTLSSLVFLVDLTLVSCAFTHRTGSLLRLRRFSLASSLVRPSDDAIELLAPAPLEYLNVDMLNCPPILTALIGQIFPNLIEIDINVSEDRIPLLLSFLHSCPRIETITIHHPPLTDTTVLPTRLPPGTIPRLKSFTGPPALAGLLSADRPVVSMELRDHRYALLASTIDTLVHTLHEISGGSVPLRSLNIWRDIPPSGVVVVFDAIYTLFPALRDLTVELLDTWLDDALADGDGYGRWVPWVPPTVPTDDSTLEFSDDGTVDYSSSESEISSRHSDAESSSSSQLESEHSDSECSASSDSESEQSDSVSTQSNADSKGSAVPPPLIPGYMYDDGGLPTPPTSYPNPPADVDKSLQLFMRSLSTVEFTLPHDLEVLRFDQQPPSHLPSPFPDADQHGAVLLLERLLPCIREIRFFRVGEYWERRGGVWTRDYPDNGVSRGGGLVKIVSLVWGEDGRWLDD